MKSVRPFFRLLISIVALSFTQDQLTSELILDGVAGVATIPSNKAYNKPAGTGFTIECWIKTKADNAGILSRWDGVNQDGFAISIEDGRIGWRVGTTAEGGHAGKVTNESYNDGCWHHIALVISPADIKLFTNGTNSGATFTHKFTASDWTISEDLKVGFSPIDNKGESFNRKFEGSIKNVRIWKTARSATDIIKTMNIENLPAKTPNLVANFTFNSTTKDSSKIGNNAKLSKGISWGNSTTRLYTFDGESFEPSKNRDPLTTPITDGNGDILINNGVHFWNDFISQGNAIVLGSGKFITIKLKDGPKNIKSIAFKTRNFNLTGSYEISLQTSQDTSNGIDGTWKTVSKTNSYEQGNNYKNRAVKVNKKTDYIRLTANYISGGTDGVMIDDISITYSKATISAESLIVTRVKNQLKWQVKDETGISKYQIIDELSKDILELFLADGTKSYETTVPANAKVSLLIFDHTGNPQKFLPTQK